MKLFILILLIPTLSIGQTKKNNGYLYLGPDVFVGVGNNSYGNFAGVALGAGYAVRGHLAIGAAFEGYFFHKGNKFGTAKLDCTAFFKGVNAKLTPLLAIQPGITLGNGYAKNYLGKGGFALDALVGMKTKINGKGGVYFSVGYGMISFNARGYNQTYDAAKAKIAISF